MCLWNGISRKKALDSALNWIDRNPSNLKILAEGTGLLMTFKEKERAAYYLSELKNLALRDIETLSLTGKMAESGGDLASAEKWYTAALVQKPDDLTNERYLVNVLLR